jgi:hypothetical protein
MRASSPVSAIRNRRRPVRALALAAAFALAWTGELSAQGATAPSPDVARVASYLPGFIQYVRWPTEESLGAWQVCAPAEPKGRTAAYDTRPARGKPVTVRPLAAGESPAGCQILDLTDASAASVKALLAQARRQPILTVGDDAAFCTAGGAVCLRPGDETAGFEINLTAVQEAGLRVNAQLLNLGRKRQPARGHE